MKKQMVELVHNDYEKISDICMWLNREYVVKFNVDLNKHTEHRKDNYHKEFGYISSDGDYRINISRDITPYLSIESIKRTQEGNKIQIRIGMNDIYFFKEKLNIVASLFTDSYFDTLFIKRNGKLMITKKVEPITASVMYNSYIEFEPAVLTLQNEEQIAGVNMYLNSDNIFTFLDTNTLLSFVYFIETFNMYQSAQLMLSYIGRPENGTNYIDYAQNNPRFSGSSYGFFNRVNAKPE